MRKAVIIPSDPIDAYEKKGTSSWLEEYYNPLGYFDKVYVVSPLEKHRRQKYGLEIIPVDSSKQYKNLLNSIKPDVVRAYGGYWACDWAVYNKKPRVPVVVSVHDRRDEYLHNSIVFADYVISMSNVVNDLLLSRGVKKERIFLLGNRVDLEVFRKYDKQSQEVQRVLKNFPKGKLILHIGRKDSYKNLDTVIKSLKYLDQDYYAVFIGKEYNDNYRKLADTEKVSDRCYWLDRVENDQLPYWYSACDVFCVPSRAEGFGLVFIEAAACECKIVTSNIKPMNGYFVNNTASLVDDYNDPKKIAEAIQFSVRNTSESKKTRSVAEMFSKPKIDRKEVKIYQEVINRGENSNGNLINYHWNKLLYRIRQ